MKNSPHEMFKILGVDTRLKIIEMLKDHKDMGAKELADKCGITVSAISQHLKILKHAGIVNSRREGYHIPYSLNEDYLEKCGKMLTHICKCHHHHNMHEISFNNPNDLSGYTKEELIEMEKMLKMHLKIVQQAIKNIDKES